MFQRGCEKKDLKSKESLICWLELLHVMVGSALLTAYKNAGGDINLEDALMEMQSTMFFVNAQGKTSKGSERKTSLLL